MNQENKNSFGIGAPVRRKEDGRLIVGQGRYTADLFPTNYCHAAFVRSPHAHALINSIEASEALKLPGVLSVLTGAEVVDDGLKPIPHNNEWTGPPDVKLHIPDGFEVFRTEHMILPTERVRYVGEAVALVVAETRAAALDGAELVQVDYNVLPAVSRALDAIKPDAPVLWPECAGNLALVCEVGNAEATEAAFKSSAFTVKLDTWIHRVTGSPMETRTIIGEFDGASGQYILRTGSGRGVDRLRQQLAEILGVAVENCRVACGDMGGNFGTRNGIAVESALLPWAARRIGRPIKWIADRTECFLSDYQGRDLHVTGELALDKDGTFVGLRGTNVSNLGAYTAYFSPLRKGLGIGQGVYRIPNVHVKGQAVLTNTPSTIPYRSAGRPEVIYVIERLIDLAADLHGFDRIELRRRNLIAPDQMPFTNGVGITYDSGNYALGMSRAMELADWRGFEARRKQSRRRGRFRGIGLANYIEGAGGAPRERVELTIRSDGSADFIAGTMNSGQGHETSFAQLVNEWLGVPFDAVRLMNHDTEFVKAGGGSHSGRSMRFVSLCLSEAVEQIIEQGREVAAQLLQADASAIAFEAGAFRLEGTNATADLFAVAAALEASGKSLQGIGDLKITQGSYPSGTHICEVEVDPDTGNVEILAWSGVDDVGRAINPMILHGQAHGAIAQGVGQALMEQCVYTEGDAQMMSASFMDYAMPRSDTLPSIKTELMEVPATSHKFGIRPGGEGGTTPALAAVINAIVHALSDLGVRHIEMPATPARVWRAIQEANTDNC